MYPDDLFEHDTIQMQSDLPFEERMRFFYNVWLPEQQRIYGSRIIDIGYSEHKVLLAKEKP
jgi:hypothetical protein